MKKLIMAVAMTAVMAVSASAFAANYDPGAQSVVADSEETSYKTVLITKEGNTNDIVYVNQDDSGIKAATKFLMKNPDAEGTYVLKMGGSSTAGVIEEEFIITSGNLRGEKELTSIGAEITDEAKKLYRKGFTLGGTVDIVNYQSIVVTYGTKSLAYPLADIGLGDLRGNAYFGIQITDIPEEAKELTVSLSKNVALEQRTQSTNE